MRPFDYHPGARTGAPGTPGAAHGKAAARRHETATATERPSPTALSVQQEAYARSRSLGLSSHELFGFIRLRAQLLLQLHTLLPGRGDCLLLSGELAIEIGAGLFQFGLQPAAFVRLPVHLTLGLFHRSPGRLQRGLHLAQFLG